MGLIADALSLLLGSVRYVIKVTRSKPSVRGGMLESNSAVFIMLLLLVGVFDKHKICSEIGRVIVGKFSFEGVKCAEG